MWVRSVRVGPRVRMRVRVRVRACVRVLVRARSGRGVRVRLRARALAAPRRLAAAALGGARKGRRRRGRGGTTVARLQATLAAQPCTHAARLPQPHLLRPLLPVLAAHAAHRAVCVRRTLSVVRGFLRSPSFEK